MLRIIFLGTSAAVSNIHRDNTSFLIEDVLVDCPGNAFGKLLKAGYNPMNLKAVIVTHRHVDHSYGLVSLLEMLRLSGKDSIKVYLGEDFLVDVEQVLKIYGLVRGDFSIELVPVRVGSVLFEGPFRMESFPVRHSVPNFGLKITTFNVSVVYTSDTEPCEEVVKRSKNVDVLIHEATCSETITGRKEGHTCVEDAARIAKEAGAKTLCLVHLGPELEEHIVELKKKAEEIFEGEVVIPNDFDRMIV
ncbi:MAG: MBL fold metallo-hydrolase [Pseudothermotoga sp.]|nr:MBL fold metallo-hydrolase [Pseudothermotoga sp.]